MAMRRSRTPYGSWLKPTPRPGEAACARQLPVNVEVAPDRILLCSHLPGFAPEQIDVRTTQRDVSISTHRPVQGTAEQRVTHEVYLGNWYRRIRLPHAVRPDLATVTYDNGELTICLPRVTPARSIILTLPGSQVFDRLEIPMRTSADLSPPSPGRTGTIFNP
ncbi:MAG TPA: Hsp20/alpha crystallin family protein [Chloroflexota bacterium]|nr:Hsp20/alpha crystallin family protein [Chloroflexota bacterium]